MESCCLTKTLLEDIIAVLIIRNLRESKDILWALKIASGRVEASPQADFKACATYTTYAQEHMPFKSEYFAKRNLNYFPHQWHNL